MRNVSLKDRLLATTTLMSCVAWTPAAGAELSSPDSNSSVAAEQEHPSSHSGDLEEIVVSATRRDVSALNVPISISALNAAALDNLGIRDFADVARAVPGLTFTPGWDGSTNVSIRGISSPIGAGTTGVYIDDTPIQVRFVGAGSTSTNAYPAVFDLERIEVLRGPQGTLFGAGSEGGTIRFITPEPGMRTYSGYARAETSFTDGGNPSYESGAAFGGPIIDNVLGFRVSAYVRQDGGWLDRASYPSGDVTQRNSNSQDTVVLNGAITVAPADDLKITAAVFYQDIHRDDLGSYWANLSDAANGIFKTGQPLEQPGSDHFILPSLKVQWAFNGMTAISNTSYLNRRNPSTADYSSYIPELLGGSFYVPAAANFTSPADFLNTQQVFTQEIRLQSSDSDDRLTWVVGSFFQRSRQESTETIYSPQLNELTNALYGVPVIDAFGVGLGPGGLSYLGIDSTVDQQTAGFGQIDLKLASDITLTAGARIAKTKFSFVNSQQGPLNGGNTASTGAESQTPVTPKVGLSYKPVPDWLLYASAAKGFREGGANTAVSADRCAVDLNALGLTQAPSKYDADTVWSYEVGAKGRAFDGHVQIESSVFYIPWKNTQEVVPLTDCGFRYIANVGSALSQGFDLEIDWRVIDGFTLGASVARTDAKYTATALGGALPGGGRAVIVNNGDPLPVAPWQVHSSAEYSFSVHADKDAYLRITDDYSSSYHSGPGANSVAYDPELAHQDSLRYSTLRAGVRTQAWDASFFVNNLLNSDSTLNITHDTLASPLVRIDTYRPRTIGVTATYRY
jgi:iron complex outermembrane recepter protein